MITIYPGLSDEVVLQKFYRTPLFGGSSVTGQDQSQAQISGHLGKGSMIIDINLLVRVEMLGGEWYFPQGWTQEGQSVATKVRRFLA